MKRVTTKSVAAILKNPQQFYDADDFFIVYANYFRIKFEFQTSEWVNKIKILFKPGGTHKR